MPWILEANCLLAFQLCRLYKFIEQKGELQDLTPTINSLIKQKTGVAQLVKYGLKDLEEVVGLLKKLGIKLQVWQLILAVPICSINNSTRRKWVLFY